MSNQPDGQITNQSWLVWQLADSAFPVGGFAHSLGLEAAWQQGEVDGRTLPSYVRDAIGQAGHGGLPFVTAAHQDPAQLGSVDWRYDSFVRNTVANRASRVQGRAWMSAIERSFATPAVRALVDTIKTDAAARHFAPVFGATLCALDVDLHTAQRLFLFSACRGVLSAAVRLGLVGTNGAQRVLAESAADLDRTLTRCSALTMDEAAQTAPLIDLWQGAHDRLYSRLFQS